MCGRFASARKRAELLTEFGVERDRASDALPPDYNVAPTKPVYAVLARGKGGGAAQEEDVARELRVVRWGLVPSWAKDVAIGSKLINARAETVDSKPAFRAAFVRRRCLLPADGFYEWQESASGARARKQPYFIHRRDGGILAFAGLYELWRDRAHSEDDPDAWLWTATIITTRAQDEVGTIHDRMPMVIEPQRWTDWLDPGNTDPAHLRALLAPALSGGLVSYPVSTEVNSVRNNGPRLLEPLAVDGAAPSAGLLPGAARGTGRPATQGPTAAGRSAAGPGVRAGDTGPPHGGADANGHLVGAPLTLF